MEAIGKYRWVIVTLLFFATTINYIDRQVIGLLKPILAKEFSWDERDYGYIVMAFQACYAFGLLIFGKITDRIGTKKGYSLSILVWSGAAMLHAVVRSTFGFGIARAALGLGESGNFPVAIKSVAEWFPKKERAFATGIFNSGTNIGAVIAPVMVPLVMAIYGWRGAFIVTGALGFVWLIFWLIFYEVPSRQQRLKKPEYAYIHSDPDEIAELKNTTPLSWMQLLSYRQTWVFVAGKFLTDPIWWFFLFWLPDYFNGTFHLDLSRPGWALVLVYSATSLGSIGGGYLSSLLIAKGWPVARARKFSMLVFAICVLPVVTARYATSLWVVASLISLAAAAHQAWSATIFTTASDMFPKKAVSSVVGIGGMAGALGGVLFPLLVSNILEYFQNTGNKTAGYNIIFVICGFAYLFAWLLMHFLMPRTKRITG